MSKVQLSTQEFADTVGTSPRNVRYLLAEGAIPTPPTLSGRSVFGQEHVAAYAAYQSLLACGLSAKQIGALSALPKSELEEITKTLLRIGKLRNAERKELA